MRAIKGNNGGGTLYLREKGDPSPKKGKTYVSSSAFVANCRRERRPRQERKDDIEALRYLFEMTPDQWRELIDGGLLTGDKCVEVEGWLDERYGYENLRRSKERVYGKPTEHTDITTGGNPLDNALSRLTASQLDELIDKLAKDDIRSDRR